MGREQAILTAPLVPIVSAAVPFVIASLPRLARQPSLAPMQKLVSSGIFNVADIYVTTGVLMLCFNYVRKSFIKSET